MTCNNPIITIDLNSFFSSSDINILPIFLITGKGGRIMKGGTNDEKCVYLNTLKEITNPAQVKGIVAQDKAKPQVSQANLAIQYRNEKAIAEVVQNILLEYNSTIQDNTKKLELASSLIKFASITKAMSDILGAQKSQVKHKAHIFSFKSKISELNKELNLYRDPFDQNEPVINNIRCEIVDNKINNFIIEYNTIYLFEDIGDIEAIIVSYSVTNEKVIIKFKSSGISDEGTSHARMGSGNDVVFSKSLKNTTPLTIISGLSKQHPGSGTNEQLLNSKEITIITDLINHIKIINAIKIEPTAGGKIKKNKRKVK